MSTSAIKAAGAVLAVGDGATPETYTTIGELKNWDGPNIATDKIETTDLSETCESSIPGINRPGEMSFDCNFKVGDSGQALVRTRCEARTSHNFKITFIDATYRIFAGFISAMSEGGEIGGVVATKFTITITGMPTRSEA